MAASRSPSTTAPLSFHDLRVPAFGGALELRAGVTGADTAPLAVQVDDVGFFVF